MPKQRLELTWIGKNNRPKLEPRILIEDPEKSFGDPDTENMLIHGDNLLALKALEQEYSGKVKCIYIDPPYNTGNAFEHYEDGLEHSIWLNLMMDRIAILRNLLSQDGSLWITLDDNEVYYCKVMCDEIFGRSCFITAVSWKISDNSNNNVLTFSEDHNHILLYAKRPDWRPNFLNYPKRRSHFKNPDNDPRGPWFDGNPVNNPGLRPNLQFNITGPYGDTIKHPPNGWRWSKATIEEKLKTGELRFSDDGKRLIRRTYLNEAEGLPPSNLWDDLEETGHNRQAKYELKALFPERKVTDLFMTPKPEKLIKTVIELSSNPDDIVLDSFLGSGTTAAVAHKMGRRWIGIELGDHCYTHCKPRLDKVVSGEDQGGISKAVEWKGGGGYRFYELAPSLLNKDSFGNWVINKKYNADMLAAAMAKHEGFRYSPDPEVYWKQGQSTERDFIFTTTEFFSQEHLDHIESQMSEGESLLICCKAFNADDRRFPNVTIKKIPQILMGKCEFGKEDYSLNIVNVPFERDIQDLQPDELSDSELKPHYVAGQQELFDLEDSDE